MEKFFRPKHSLQQFGNGYFRNITKYSYLIKIHIHAEYSRYSEYLVLRVPVRAPPAQQQLAASSTNKKHAAATTNACCGQANDKVPVLLSSNNNQPAAAAATTSS